MKKTLVYLLASLVVVMMSAKVYAKIEWSGNIMAGIEKMDYGVDKVTVTVPPVWPATESTTEDVNAEDKLQFSNTKLNLDVKADVCDGVKGVAELRTSDWSLVSTRQVYVEITDLLIPDASIRIGGIELPLGAEVEKISENADTMKNPLIFNSLLGDLLEYDALDYGLMIAKTIGGVDAKLAISNGTGEQKDNNSDKAITLNLSGSCPAVPGLCLAGTYYTNDNADKSVKTDEETGWLLDVAYETGLLKLAANMGNLEEKEVSETTDTDYLMFEVVYGNGETPWWVAARHSTKKPTTSPGTDPKDDVKRLQLGAGYKLCDNTYLKVEYIDHEVKDEKKNLEDYDGIKAIVNVAF